MSDAAPPPWVKLTGATAHWFKLSTIEARRTTEPGLYDLGAKAWNEPETHETQGLTRDGFGQWLRVAGDGLLVDGPWEVRLVSRRLHRDACAFVA